MTDILGMDHPVIAVRDMDAGRAAYERLGFTIPPRGSHLEWGTGNWCIMFEHDYLELRGIVDASRYTHNLDAFLAKREGLMGVAFAVADAAAAHARATARGVHPREPRELTRRFELPEGDTFPKFRLVFIDEGETPGFAGVLMIQHLTPELIRRPVWLAHANGAIATKSMTAVAADPEAGRAPYRRLFGDDAVSGDARALKVRTGRKTFIDILAPAEAAARGLALAGVNAPYMAAMAVRVRDVAVTAAILDKNGVPFTRRANGDLRVAPAHTCGVVTDFSAHDD